MTDPEFQIQKGKRPQSLMSPIIYYGVIAGVIISIYFLVMHALIEYQSITTGLYIRYSKFIWLAIVLYFAIRNYRYHYRESFQFAKGMMLGFGVSVVASIVLIAGELIVYTINPEWVFEPMYYPSETLGDRIIGMLLATSETTAIGGIIISLAWMVLLQRSVGSEVN